MIASTSRVGPSMSSSSGITKRSSSSSPCVNVGKKSDVYVVRKMRRQLLRATSEDGTEGGESSSSSSTSTATKASSIVPDSFDRDLNKFVKKTATTFAPSSSGEAKKKKNPATKGTVLYTVFEVQAYLAILVGGLLAFNVIYPSEEPTIALDAAEMRGANVHSARSASSRAARFAASAASARAFLRAKRSATDSLFATEV